MWVAPPASETWRPYHRERTMSRDYVTGEACIKMLKDRGHHRLEETDTEFSGGGVETYTVREGEPLSARARLDYHATLKRGDAWDTRVEAIYELTATEDSFLLSCRAEAHDQGVRFWSKSWDEEIPRHGV